jgi:membrane-bound ClpP family serine protease
MTLLIITLIIAGLLLLAAELVLIPGFGVAGILGIASLVGSCWVAFTQVSTAAGIITLVANIVLAIISTIVVLRSKTWKKLSLNTNIDAKVDSDPHKKGILVGDNGVTLTRLAPAGKIKIGENVVEAFTRDSLIEPGQNVTVTEIDGNKVFVK